MCGHAVQITMLLLAAHSDSDANSQVHLQMHKQGCILKDANLQNNRLATTAVQCSIRFKRLYVRMMKPSADVSLIQSHVEASSTGWAFTLLLAISKSAHIICNIE